jgi:hypothetical protein
MPDSRTFTIPPIAELLADEGYDADWLDPFPYPFRQDAIEFMRSMPSESRIGAVFDPPYSQRQLREMYNSIGGSLQMNNGYWAKCRDELARIIKPGGKCISFGWNSNGLGVGRGFTITRILLVAHGSQHNDTIVTVETK